MYTLISTAVIGLIISVLGIINMTGNISTLHRYHRNKVSEENKKPFGRLVGLGTLIIGIAVIIYGVLMFIFEETKLDYIAVIGTVELIVGIIAGIIPTFYAMKKYNNGIF